MTFVDLNSVISLLARQGKRQNAYTRLVTLAQEANLEPSRRFASWPRWRRFSARVVFALKRGTKDPFTMISRCSILTRTNHPCLNS
jgi:hypothetical protein